MSDKPLNIFIYHSKNYQICSIIFRSILLLIRLIVDSLQCISGAHSSKVYSLFLKSKSCSSLGVKLHSLLKYSLFSLLKSGIMFRAMLYFFLFAVPLAFLSFLVLLLVTLVFATFQNLLYLDYILWC